MIGIYKIENLLTHQCYIGQSSDIFSRWRWEYADAFNPNSQTYNYPLQIDFRIYPKDKFSFSIIEECKKDELYEKEKFWIKFYDSYNNGYNQSEGGEGASKISEEQLKNIVVDLKNTDLSITQLSEQYKLHKRTIDLINNGIYYFNENENYPIRKSNSMTFITIDKNSQANGICHNCGKIISRHAYYCKNCYTQLQQSVSSCPTAEELYDFLVINKGNFTLAGKKYNVCDNTVRKWCKKYNLPSHSKDYKK